MKYSTNYNLKKPELTDNAKIEDINENTETIDAKLKENADAVASHKADYVALKYAGVYRLNKDTNGKWTTIQYKTKDTGKLLMQSVLSGGTSPQYTTRTETWYDTDGTTVVGTFVYPITYDADGDWISEV